MQLRASRGSLKKSSGKPRGDRPLIQAIVSRMLFIAPLIDLRKIGSPKRQLTPSPRWDPARNLRKVIDPRGSSYTFRAHQKEVDGPDIVRPLSIHSPPAAISST